MNNHVLSYCMGINGIRGTYPEREFHKLGGVRVRVRVKYGNNYYRYELTPWLEFCIGPKLMKLIQRISDVDGRF